MTRKAIMTALWLTILLAPVAAKAQGPLDAELIVCFFETVANNDGRFDPNGFFVERETFGITFVKEGDDYYMVGNAGRSQVYPAEVFGQGLVLLERVPSGTYQVTAIDSNLNAVHSRHTFFMLPSSSDGAIVLEVIPSQYYGECQIQ